MEGIEQGAYDAVFDEGITGWTADARRPDMVLLRVAAVGLRRNEQLGFRRSAIPKSAFPAGPDSSPWSSAAAALLPSDFPDDLAYAVVKAIAARKDTMPVDGDRFDMSRICRDTEEGPMCIPLHPGAERYYREAGLVSDQSSLPHDLQPCSKPPAKRRTRRV